MTAINADITYCCSDCAFKAECGRHMIHHLQRAPEQFVWTAEFRTRGSLSAKCRFFQPRPRKKEAAP